MSVYYSSFKEFRRINCTALFIKSYKNIFPYRHNVKACHYGELDSPQTGFAVLDPDPRYGCASWSVPASFVFSISLSISLSKQLLTFPPNITTAKKFYSSMFGWTFKPPAGHFTDETVALFNLPDDQFKSLSGGICKFEKEKITQGSGATTIFLYVDDLDDASAVSLSSVS